MGQEEANVENLKLVLSDLVIKQSDTLGQPRAVGLKVGNARWEKTSE